MDQFKHNRDALLGINQEVADLIKQAREMVGTAASALNQWEQSCDSISSHLLDHVLRIAVVGAIKSGKSTLVNALLHNDYLKRGAGVVTSIVTRIRQGEHLEAHLFFKSWDEINSEIQQALILFPSEEGYGENQRFDIRRSKDREELQQALGTLDAEQRIVHDSLNANSVLLTAYLKGYEQIKNLVSAESTVQVFDAEHFSQHRAFVGDDALAVYLKDIQLHITGSELGSNIELADCQGSDSPNPLHLAMIQDYLIKANLIIYVISSRTGVRQADIRFLSMIRQMGIGDNILFVCNCDLFEHDTLDDLQTLVRRIREELDLIIPDPQLFAFSALLNLFAACGSELSSKDKDRLAQWRKSRKISAFSNDQTKQFKEALDHKLTQERLTLLLQNQLARTEVTVTGLKQWVQLNRDLSQRDAGEARSTVEKLQSHQDHIVQVETMIESTLEGAIGKIKHELRKELDRFFDRHDGPVLSKVLGYVRDYNVDLVRYQEHVANSGFTHALYMVFQDFKQAVDAYMAEKVNPEIFGFIHQQEAQLTKSLRAVAQPYTAMVIDVLAQYQTALSQSGFPEMDANWTYDANPDLQAIKQMVGVVLPPATATMRYSAHIKTEAVMRFGFYSLVRFIRKAFKKPINTDREEAISALRDSVRRMKRETEQSVRANFRDYQENVKFQYLLRLADVAGRRQYEALTVQFRAYVDDLKDWSTAIADRRVDKKQADANLGAIDVKLGILQQRLDALQQQL